MNLPNTLTILRIVLSGILFACIFSSAPWLKFLIVPIFLTAALTDYWDGRLARAKNQKTAFGALMDPIADKVLTTSAFASFWLMGVVPGLWVLVVLFRDLLVTVLRLQRVRLGQSVAAFSGGKKKTVLQMVYISFVLLYLSVKDAAFWKADWDWASLKFIQFGMVSIVLITLWSGVEILRRVLPSPESRKIRS